MSGASFESAEDELRAIIDTIPAIAARYLADGTPDFVNQTWRDYTGLSLEDLKGNHFEKWIHPDDLLTVGEQWNLHLAAGKAFVMEQRLRRADGEYRWLLIHRKPLRDADGTIINWYGVAQDIGDRKLAEDRLRATEQDLRATVNTIPSLVWQAGPDGTLDFFNDRWLEYSGQDSTQESGLDWKSLIHPEDIRPIEAAWNRMLSNGESFEVEGRMRRFDGEYRWFLIRAEPLRDDAGTVSRWYGVSVDIEEQKRTEEALLESEQRLRDFSEAASDWYWETGPDHRFTFMPNDRAVFASLAPPVRVGLFRWEAASDVDEEPGKWHAHHATLDAHKPFRNFTYRVDLRDGSAKYVSCSGIPRFDGEGHFLGYRGGASDVTALVGAEQAQRTLEQARAELSHVTRLITLGELATSIAHEVNQPLAGIAGNGIACLNWLQKTPPRPDKVRKSVEAMINDCNRAAAIIARIRALAKKTTPQKEVFDFSDLIRDSIPLVDRELRDHKIELKQEYGSDPAWIFGDRVQLQQVIINLIMNGIESMDTVHNRRRQLHIRSDSTDDEQIIVEVQDTGTGIDAVNAEKLFAAFYTTKRSGLGVGLSISRSIIEAHDGRLTAKDAALGAIFRLTLPSYKPEA
jgi:PAS domain S-box-containing protein